MYVSSQGLAGAGMNSEDAMIHMYTCTYICTYIHIYIYTYIHIYTNLYVYMYIYVLPQGLAGAGMNSEDAMIHGTLDPGRPATVFAYCYKCVHTYIDIVISVCIHIQTYVYK